MIHIIFTHIRVVSEPLCTLDQSIVIIEVTSSQEIELVEMFPCDLSEQLCIDLL